MGWTRCRHFTSRQQLEQLEGLELLESRPKSVQTTHYFSPNRCSKPSKRYALFQTILFCRRKHEVRPSQPDSGHFSANTEPPLQTPWKLTPFWRNICFVAIYPLCVEQKVSEHSCLWSKNYKYDVCFQFHLTKISVTKCTSPCTSPFDIVIW